MRTILAVPALALSLAAPAAGQLAVATGGNSLRVEVALPGGLGADVTLRFEDVTGLSLLNLGFSAQVIDPNDPALLARLPGNAVATGFPVLLRIEPPVAGGLSFRGVANLEIHTHNLDYSAGSPLRLFTAPLGGPFEDITVGMGSGSYRARGTTGGFSEFLIVIESRPIDPIIATKFDRLEEELEEYAASMPAPLHADLAARLAAARADFEAGDIPDAVEKLDGFIEVVEEHSGTDIPDLWRSARDVYNVAGYLRAGALTLRFSLDLKRGS